MKVAVAAYAAKRVRVARDEAGWRSLCSLMARAPIHIASAIVGCCAFFLSLASAHAAPPMMALSGKMNVDALGGFTYSVPIQVPPGTNGMVPHLALAYSSHAGDGYVGMGWSVSGLSAITRCPQTWAQDNQPVA